MLLTKPCPKSSENNHNVIDKYSVRNKMAIMYYELIFRLLHNQRKCYSNILLTLHQHNIAKHTLESHHNQKRQADQIEILTMAYNTCFSVVCMHACIHLSLPSRARAYNMKSLED